MRKIGTALLTVALVLLLTGSLSAQSIDITVPLPTKAMQAIAALVDPQGNISNIVFPQPPAGTTTGLDFSGWDTPGNYTIIDATGAGINDGSDRVLSWGAGGIWYLSGYTLRLANMQMSSTGLSSFSAADIVFTPDTTGHIVSATDNDSYHYFNAAKTAAIWFSSAGNRIETTLGVGVSGQLRAYSALFWSSNGGSSEYTDTTAGADDWLIANTDGVYTIEEQQHDATFVNRLVFDDTVQTNAGKPQVMLEGTGVLTDGTATTVVTYIDATPGDGADGEEWTTPDADFTEATETTTYFKEGAASLKVTIVDAASAGDVIVNNTLGGGDEDWQNRESLGVWIYSNVALSTGDLDFRIYDVTAGGGYNDLDVPAVAVNTWTWCEADQSGVANNEKDVITDIAFIYTVDKGEMIVYFDFLAKWDAADETQLGQDILTDGMLSVVANDDDAGADMAFASRAEYTDYFINYESGATDKVVTITDQSDDVFLMNYTYQ